MEIEGFENYLIYEDGKVQNNKTKRYLKPGCNNSGYLYVILCKEGKRKIHTIHRLVGLYYIPNPDNKRCVDHINRIKTDNLLENLRWATHSENNQNKGVYKNNKLGYQNICYHKTKNIYQYEKMIRGEKHKKLFKTLEKAVEYKRVFEMDI